jgi:hypothetical protein
MGHGQMVEAVQGSSVFEGLLTQCRDLAARKIDLAVGGMLEKADAALAELAGKTQNRDTQKLYLQVRDVVRAHGAEMEKQFHSDFLSEFKSRSKKGKKGSGSFAAFDADASTFELSLVADDDLEETLKFNEMAGKLRRICEDEMGALDQRVGVLLGDAELQAEENPLSPQAICDTYKKTCRKLVDSVPVRGVLLKLFDDFVADELRSMYKAVNDLLVQNQILPKIRLAAAKKSEGKSPKGAKKKDKGGKEVVEDDEDEADSGDMFAALQKLFAGQGGGGGGGPGGAGGPGGGGGMGVGGVPMMAGVELLGSLTKLQIDGLARLGESGALMASGALLAGGAPITGTTNVLHELKSSEVGASMGQMDAMTLDVVAMLFDQLFEDPKIPLGAKGLIGRVQIPMLKVAIADKDLFSRKDHPARLLLDKMAEIAIRLPADFNTGSKLFAHLETIIQGLATEYKDDVEVFNIVRDQLTQLMAREDERIQQESKAAAERVLQEEALAVAKSVAQEEIRARVEGHLGPGPVLEFLVEHWIKLMIIIHVRRGTEHDAWRNALEAMDQLIWSVQPKDTQEDRKKLATTVPPLIKRLGAGLEVAGVEHEVREFFFDSLMKAHTSIMSVPLAAKGAAPAPVPEAVLDFTAPVTVKNPYGGGEVKVTAEAADDDARHGDEVSPDDLKVGDWMEFKIKTADGTEEELRPVRLIFVTPRRSRFVFADRGEKEYIERTRAGMFNSLLNGEAVLMEEEPEVPFFERIMGGVIGKMKSKAAPALAGGR